MQFSRRFGKLNCMTFEKYQKIWSHLCNFFSFFIREAKGQQEELVRMMEARYAKKIELLKADLELDFKRKMQDIQVLHNRNP